jgi:hypothetical protein
LPLQNLEEVIKLVVQPLGCSTLVDQHSDDDETDWKTYNFSGLIDIQSKLMLVAGKAAKGKEQVDRFTEVSTIVYLFSLYI